MESKAGYRIGSSEHAEQAAVITWARYNVTKWPALEWLFAVPNGAKLPYVKRKDGQRFSPQALKLLSEGMLPGVSDLFLPAASGRWHGLFIELKHGKNTLSDEQERFIEAMLAAGYLAMACWEADQAIEAITNYLEGKL